MDKVTDTRERNYSVSELVSGLKRLIEENGKEMAYYNSDEAMGKFEVLQRTAIIKSIAADNRWINFIIYNIQEGAKFLVQNDKG